MIVAGLEEVLITKSDNFYGRKPITMFIWDQNWVSKNMKKDLRKLVELRNTAVHGLGLISVTKKDAQMALRTVKKLIENILAHEKQKYIG